MYLNLTSKNIIKSFLIINAFFCLKYCKKEFTWYIECNKTSGHLPLPHLFNINHQKLKENTLKWLPSAQSVKNLPAMQETRVQFLGQEDPLEKEMATHSSILPWRIPLTEEPGRLQSMGLQESDTTYWLNHHHHTYCGNIYQFHFAVW